MNHLDVDTALRCSKLHAEKADYEAKLTKVKKEIIKADEALQNELIRCKLPRVTIDGKTLAPRRQLWAGRPKDLTAEEFHAVLLRYFDLRGYATERCNTQGLSEHIRGIEAELEQRLDRPCTMGELHNEIEARYPGIGVLRLSENYRISITNATKPKGGKLSAADRLAVKTAPSVAAYVGNVSTDMDDTIGEGPIA